jgi:hypothetical protein
MPVPVTRPKKIPTQMCGNKKKVSDLIDILICNDKLTLKLIPLQLLGT